MGDTVMRQAHEILGQVPPEIRKSGSAREQAEEIWRALGRHRDGQQTRLAGDVAERWEPFRRSPRLSVDDPRTAAKRLARCLAGEMALDVDLYFAFVASLPEPYRDALEIMQGCETDASSGSVLDAVRTNRSVDNENDGLVTELLIRGVGSYSISELEALEKRLATEADTIGALREAIQGEIAGRRSS